MAGKPQISKSIHQAIRALYARGESRKTIARRFGVSEWTVRKAVDPEYADKCNAKLREAYPIIYPKRRSSPEFLRYHAEYGRRPERREQVRVKMAELRARRRAEMAQASLSEPPALADLTASLMRDPAIGDITLWEFAGLMRRLEAAHSKSGVRPLHSTSR